MTTDRPAALDRLLGHVAASLPDEPAPPIDRATLAGLLAFHADTLAVTLRGNAETGLPEDRPGMERAAGLLDLHKGHLLAGRWPESAQLMLDVMLQSLVAEAADEPEPAVVPGPPATRAADRDRIAKVIREFPFDDFGLDDVSYLLASEPDTQEWVPRLADAVLAVLPPSADRAAVLREAADAVAADNHGILYGTASDYADRHAALLRRMADEAQQQPEPAVVPPPALTEEGRLRAQVQVLQQDAERDRGLAKVGARCMRDGHQGLIEEGRAVIEGWRFALAVALDLGTDASWHAIHAQVKALSADDEAGGARRAADDEPAETDEERADREETEREHASGNHEYCGVTCEAEFPTEMLRNGILAKGYPGTAGMLDELLRRAAVEARRG